MPAILRKDVPQSGRIIPAGKVHVLGTMTDQTEASEVTCQESEITLLREGDCVKTIVIRCACGRVTSLDCTY
jgi:hypothetical protein